MSCTHRKTLRIGVLLLDIVQFLDVGPIDLFGIASTDYLESHGFPSDIVALGLDLSILYISPSHDDKSYDPSFAQCTAEAALKVTRSLNSPDCAPGELDILLIPGPNPAIVITPEVKDFVQGHAEVKETTVLVVCVAAFVAAQAGILDGKMATGPRGLLPQLKEKYNLVKWITKRWAVDGNIWTSGTITNGNDMVAAFLRKRYPGILSETVCSVADVEIYGMEIDKGSNFVRNCYKKGWAYAIRDFGVNCEYLDTDVKEVCVKYKREVDDKSGK